MSHYVHFSVVGGNASVNYVAKVIDPLTLQWYFSLSLDLLQFCPLLGVWVYLGIHFLKLTGGQGLRKAWQELAGLFPPNAQHFHGACEAQCAW